MFTLSITLGNASMVDFDDIADALRRTAATLESAAVSGVIFDANGNRVGTWSVS